MSKIFCKKAVLFWMLAFMGLLGAPQVIAQMRFIRSDCNVDGKVTGEVSDAIFLLQYNFFGVGKPDCLKACDANDDGEVTGQVTDAIYMLSFNFIGGPAPPLPYPKCGPDPTDDQLSCDSFNNNICEGGGIGGTGIAISVGPILRFGSIFVNGIEWDTSEAEITINENLSTDSLLRLGMVVTVEGKLDDLSPKGKATLVIFDADLKGPISSIALDGNDATLKKLVVLGRTVIVEQNVTVFDGGDPLFNFDTMAVDDVVEVSGLLDGSGAIHATRIEKEGEYVPGNTRAELKGKITNFDGASTFNIGDNTVVLTPDTDLSELPTGVQNGLFVEVKGILISAAKVAALKIELEEEELGDDFDHASIEGFISDFINAASFKVSGQAVDASRAALRPDDPSRLRNGVKVEVKGSIVNGVLVADEVAFKGGEVKIEARLKDAPVVDGASGTMVLLGIKVAINSSTQFEGGEDGRPFGLADIRAGDFLKLKGFGVGEGVVATRIKRERVEEIKLRGFVQASDPAAGTLTILGLMIQTGAQTEFRDENDVSIPSAAAFFERLKAGDLVEVVDEGDGDETAIDVADEVEFEGEHKP